MWMVGGGGAGFRPGCRVYDVLVMCWTLEGVGNGMARYVFLFVYVARDTHIR